MRVVAALRNCPLLRLGRVALLTAAWATASGVESDSDAAAAAVCVTRGEWSGVMAQTDAPGSVTAAASVVRCVSRAIASTALPSVCVSSYCCLRGAMAGGAVNDGGTVVWQRGEQWARLGGKSKRKEFSARCCKRPQQAALDLTQQRGVDRTMWRRQVYARNSGGTRRSTSERQQQEQRQTREVSA